MWRGSLLQLRGRNPIGFTALLAFTAGLAIPAVVFADLHAAVRIGLERSGRVDPELVDRLEGLEVLDIVVVYRVELPASISSASKQARKLARRARIAEMRDRLLARLPPGGFSSRGRLAAFPVIAGSADLASIVALSKDSNVLRVGINTRFEVQLAEAVPLVGLTALHAGGSEGAGIQIATIDTGVDGLHLDLSDSLIDEQCFCSGSGGCCPGGGTSQSGVGAAEDEHGHGTRVAGVLTSNASSAPLGGANDAELVAVRTMDSGGGGGLADILSGLNWVLTDRPDVDLVNMSIGAGLYPAECDADDATTMALAAAVDALWDSGILVVAASGNDGSGSGMMVPACLSHTVSVGATWDADVGSKTVFGCTDATTQVDQVACYSNSSPTTDVFAPGGSMTSSRFGGGTITSHGTSYATPLVSACGALLLENYPDSTPDQLAQALTTSEIEVVDATSGLSFPRLDCAAAAAFLEPEAADPKKAIPSLSPWSTGLLLASLSLALAGLYRRQRS